VATTRIVFARDHHADVTGRIQEVNDALSEALRTGTYVSYVVHGTRLDVNPRQVRCLEMVGDPAEHSAS
jgi:hypothetical protein